MAVIPSVERQVHTRSADHTSTFLQIAELLRNDLPDFLGCAGVARIQPERLFKYVSHFLFAHHSPPPHFDFILRCHTGAPGFTSQHSAGAPVPKTLHAPIPVPLLLRNRYTRPSCPFHPNQPYFLLVSLESL